MGVEGRAALAAARRGNCVGGLAGLTAPLLRLLLACALLVLVVGCNGGTVDRHALTNDSATLNSIACEGALLAGDVARGRTTTYFAREQAEELRIQSSNFADALARRKALPSIVRRVREKAKQAAVLAAVLQRLHNHPSDHAVGAVVANRLKKLGSCP
jgi:hypothetical protein